MKRTLAVAAALLLAPALVLAQDLGLEADPAQMLAVLMQLVSAGQFVGAGVVAFILALKFGRPVLVKAVPFFGTDAGGTLLATVVAPASIVAGAALGGAPVTGSLVLGTVAFSWLSGQTYTVGRRVLVQVIAGKVAQLLREHGGVVGRFVAPFVERPIGKVLDLAREAILKRVRKDEPEVASAAAPLTADVPALEPVAAAISDEAPPAPASPVRLVSATDDELAAEQARRGE